jgi:hypothetical protein
VDRTAIEKIVGEAIAAHNGTASMPVFKPEDLIRRVGEAYDEEVMRETQSGINTVGAHPLTLRPPNPQPEAQQRVVLCVRMRPIDVPVPVCREFREAFPNDFIRLIYVNPQTPEELDEMTEWPDVAAVYLQEQPLPSIVLTKSRIPCVLMDKGRLRRLIGIIPNLREFSGLPIKLS